MKSTSLLSLLLVAACASSDGFEPHRIECGPGQLVTIDAGFDDPRAPREEVDDQRSLVVRVGNNSDQDIVVKTISADQVQDSRSIYRIEHGSGTFDQTVAEGEEGEFKIRMMGRATRPSVESEALRRSSVLLDVRVELGNGDSYRCRFELPIR